MSGTEEQAATSAADYLRRAYHLIADNKPAALAAFEAGLIVHPDDPDLLRGAGHLFAGAGRHADAARCFGHLATTYQADADWVSWASVLAPTGDHTAIEAAARLLMAAKPSAAEPWFSFGSAAAQSGDWLLAEQLFRAAVTRAPTAANNRALANALMHLRRPREAAELFLPLAAERGATPADWIAASNALAAAGDPVGAGVASRIAILAEAEAGAQRLGLGEVALRMGLNADRAELIAQLTSRPETPPILIISMPKSGSIFLGRSLSESLGKRLLDVHHSGSFPDIGLANWAMRTLAASRGVYVMHVAPTRFNLTEIEQHLDRVVVHVRDPRQAMISWCHFLKNVIETFDTPMALHYGLPDGFAAMPFDVRLDWLIDNHLPLWIEWADKWRQIAENPATRFRVLISRHEDMAENPDAFFARLLAFHDIDPAKHSLPRRPRAGKLNFRSGETNEWRARMTPQQQVRAAAQIPREAAAAFGWPLD